VHNYAASAHALLACSSTAINRMQEVQVPPRTVSEVALAAVDAVEVGGHEDAWAALRADLAQALHLARVVHLVELEHAQLDLLVPAAK
jgi:hypothetical protein